MTFKTKKRNIHVTDNQCTPVLEFVASSFDHFLHSLTCATVCGLQSELALGVQSQQLAELLHILLAITGAHHDHIPRSKPSTHIQHTCSY